MKNTLITVLLFCFFSLVSNAQHSNIRISTLNYPNEPSIALDPKNPRYIVAGANINSYYYSSDTGRTWSTGSLSSTYGVWGDPTIIFDTAGGVYFFHLSNRVLNRVFANTIRVLFQALPQILSTNV